MKTFAVRLNPDPRENVPWYSIWPTQKQYDAFYEELAMDGFHEAVNYLSESGFVRGYVPPLPLRAMRDGEPFILISVTAVGAGDNGDMITGIQVGCRYCAPDGNGLRREGGRRGAAALTFHYVCPSNLSLLFSTPLPNARARLLARTQNWGQGPTKELTRQNIAAQILHLAIRGRHVRAPDARPLLETIGAGRVPDYDEMSGEPKGTEGTITKRLINHRKRETKLRRAKIGNVMASTGHLRCEVPGCGFEFKERYGELGKEFAEVHHIVPLGGRGSKARTTRLSDLAIVCANCHRMIHRGGESRSLSNLIPKKQRRRRA